MIQFNKIFIQLQNQGIAHHYIIATVVVIIIVIFNVIATIIITVIIIEVIVIVIVFPPTKFEVKPVDQFQCFLKFKILMQSDGQTL